MSSDKQFVSHLTRDMFFISCKCLVQTILSPFQPIVLYKFILITNKETFHHVCENKGRIFHILLKPFSDGVEGHFQVTGGGGLLGPPFYEGPMGSQT